MIILIFIYFDFQTKMAAEVINHHSVFALAA